MEFFASVEPASLFAVVDLPFVAPADTLSSGPTAAGDAAAAV